MKSFEQRMDIYNKFHGKTWKKCEDNGTFKERRDILPPFLTRISEAGTTVERMLPKAVSLHARFAKKTPYSQRDFFSHQHNTYQMMRDPSSREAGRTIL